jgi:hypothetical protein
MQTPLIDGNDIISTAVHSSSSSSSSSLLSTNNNNNNRNNNNNNNASLLSGSNIQTTNVLTVEQSGESLSIDVSIIVVRRFITIMQT